MSRRRDPDNLYHYTTNESAKAIKKSGKIKQSFQNAQYGPGLYMTGMTPSSSTEDLVANNYGPGRVGDPEFTKRTEAYVEVPYPAVKGRTRNVGDDDRRDIHLHHGDLDLTKTQHRVGSRIPPKKTTTNNAPAYQQSFPRQNQWPTQSQPLYPMQNQPFYPMQSQSLYPMQSQPLYPMQSQPLYPNYYPPQYPVQTSLNRWV